MLSERFGLTHTTLQVEHAVERDRPVSIGPATRRETPLRQRVRATTATRILRVTALDGKSAIVTGASSGIGARSWRRSEAKACAWSGARAVPT